jgi:hypothetical protein
VWAKLLASAPRYTFYSSLILLEFSQNQDFDSSTTATKFEKYPYRESVMVADNTFPKIHGLDLIQTWRHFCMKLGADTTFFGQRLSDLGMIGS